MSEICVTMNLTQKNVQDAQQFYLNSDIFLEGKTKSDFRYYQLKKTPIKSPNTIMSILLICVNIISLPFGFLFFRIGGSSPGASAYGLNGLPDERLKFVNQRREEKYAFNEAGIFRTASVKKQVMFNNKVLPDWSSPAESDAAQETTSQPVILQITDWSGLYGAFENKKYFFYYLTFERVLVIPKKCIDSPCKPDDLRDLTKSKTKLIYRQYSLLRRPPCT
ncbi:MAG: hypothetical protein FWF44_03585 [Defluviitaleaceae bacterium]|nr:hypothetical protein [Defluviitaleaceae bacterium]